MAHFNNKKWILKSSTGHGPVKMEKLGTRQVQKKIINESAGNGE